MSPKTTSGVGVLYRATETSDLVGLAKAAEERGFDALVMGEHTHIPVDSDPTQFPGGNDEIPQSYARLLDPYIALSFVAATTSLKIGTSTSLPAEHDPIALAKAVATLDHLSGGRVTFGVGFGWNSAELENHGRPFKQRRTITREHVELMRELWRHEEAEYHGELTHMAKSWMWPKPVQENIPVLLGVAAGEKGMQAIVDWGDGWMPGGPPAWLSGKLADLRARWTDAGRAGKPIVWLIQGFEQDDDAARAHLESLRPLEVDQVLISFDGTDPDEILPVLDRYGKLLGS
jgi:probable F420-dependent oxidoreductase